MTGRQVYAVTCAVHAEMTVYVDAPADRDLDDIAEWVALGNYAADLVHELKESYRPSRAADARIAEWFPGDGVEVMGANDMHVDTCWSWAQLQAARVRLSGKGPGVGQTDIFGGVVQ